VTLTLRISSASLLAVASAAFGAGSGVPPVMNPRLTVDGGFGGGDGFGFSATGITGGGGGADFNGDGVDDFVVGSPFYSKPLTIGEATNTGKITIFFGFDPMTMCEPIPPLEIVNPPPAPNVLQPDPHALFGFSLGPAFTAISVTQDPVDDYADIIVGAPGANVVTPSGTVLGAGVAYIIPGRPFSTDPFDRARVADRFDPFYPWVELNATTSTTAPQRNARFGYSVHGAGGDTFFGWDVVVGAPYSDLPGAPDAGLAFVFGDGTGPASPSLGQVLMAPMPEANALFGFSVSGGGYFNDDILRDIIVGEPRRDANPLVDVGAAYLFTTASLGNGQTSYSVECTLSPPGAASGDYFGYSVAELGDFVIGGSGGIDEVAVGAPGRDNGMGPGQGAAFVFGWIGEGSCQAILAVYGASSGDRFGFCVSGGVNMNGASSSNVSTDELFVGAPFANGGAGLAYVYLGSDDGMTVDNVPDCTLPASPQAGAYFGFCVARGYELDLFTPDVSAEEMIVGAPGSRPAPSPSVGGSVEVYSYSTATNDCVARPAFGASGSVTGEGLGYWLTIGADWVGPNPGDIGPDGAPEIVAGAPLFDSIPAPGMIDIFDLVRTFQPADTGRVCVINGATGAIQWILRDSANRQHGFFGASGAVGNFVGDDNTLDIVIGAPSYEDADPGDPRGAIFLFPGSALVAAPAGSVVTATPLFPLSDAGDSYGFAVAWAGDVVPSDPATDPQKEDFLVGSPRIGSTTGTPRAILYRGATTPAGISAAQTFTGAPGSEFGRALASIGRTLPSSSDYYVAIGAPRGGTPQTGQVFVYTVPSGSALPVISRGGPGARFGYSLARLRDQNMDLVNELVVGSPHESNLMSVQTGAVRVINVTNQSDLLLYYGQANQDDFGFSVSSVASANLDTYHDLVVGAPRYDGAAGSDLGRTYVLTANSVCGLFMSTGVASRDRLGFSVAGWPLVLTSSTVDVVSGAPQFDTSSFQNAGRVYVYNPR